MNSVYEEKDKAMNAVKRILSKSKRDVQRFIEFNQRFVHDPSDVMEFLSVLKARARQNVIFEMGYFWGLLERKKVCCLLKGDVERPSDIHGIVYVPFKESVDECHDEIVTELNEAGYEIQIDAIIDSAQVLEINNVKMEVINRNLKVSFDIRNIGESNILSLSVFGVIFDKNDTKASAESTESLGKLPKGKRMPIIQQFSNYDSNFETLTILVKNDEEILTQELKIDECLKKI